MLWTRRRVPSGCVGRARNIGTADGDWLIKKGKDEEEEGDDDEDEAAGFGAEHAASEPIGAGPGSLQEMADGEFAGVASGVEEHGSPIESGVEADDKCERASAANGEAAE